MRADHGAGIGERGHSFVVPPCPAGGEHPSPSNAWGSNLPPGSRISTQRSGTVGMPL
ncbi:MAG TPA: hypothetical protein VMW65_17565 [Chloroflexota bacterium]|nr:hypothetical protein [Chloroflexota bacterium]